MQNVLPHYITTKYHLYNPAESFKNIHFPSNTDTLKFATNSLKFEELFFIQLKLLRTKLLRTQKFKGSVFTKVGYKFTEFYHNLLPFNLTNAQKRVIKEIRLSIHVFYGC